MRYTSVTAVRFLLLPLSLALLSIGCSPVDETVAPVPAPPATCPSTPPVVGFPGSGILHVDAPIPGEPFTPAPHRAAPPLVVEDADVIASPRIVSLVASDDPLGDTLLAFGDDVPASAWWPAVSSEFGVGPLGPSARAVGAPMKGTMTKEELVAYAEKHGPPPDGNTIYVVYLSPGVDYVNPKGARNCGCSLAAAAHFRMASGANDSIAWVQRCTGAPEQLTVAASHEILESATDPTLKDGYVAPGGKEPWTRSVWAAINSGSNELADFCEGTRVHEGEWEYQRSFSNIAAQTGGDYCAPAISEPYYNVTVDQDWYPVAPGGSVTIDVTGWSTGPREHWFLIPRLTPAAAASGFSAVIESDVSASSSGVVYHGINNGEKATLTLTAPDGPAGAHAVVRITSRPGTPGSDVSHYWPVGVFVQ